MTVFEPHAPTLVDTKDSVRRAQSALMLNGKPADYQEYLPSPSKWQRIASWAGRNPQDDLAADSAAATRIAGVNVPATVHTPPTDCAHDHCPKAYVFSLTHGDRLYQSARVRLKLFSLELTTRALHSRLALLPYQPRAPSIF